MAKRFLGFIKKTWLQISKGLYWEIIALKLSYLSEDWEWSENIARNFNVFLLDQLSELAKFSTQKSINLLSDVKHYRNKIYAVFYIHTLFISNSIFLVRTLFAWAREPSQISNCFRGCLEIKWLIKSSKEKSYLFVNGTKPSVFIILMKSLDNRSLFFLFFLTVIFR